MSIIGAKGGAAAVYEIGHSLRLRAAASASLSTTGFTSGGTPNKLTFSTRIKRGKLGYQALVVTYSDANNIGAFYINGNDRIQYYNWQAGAFTVNKESVAVFRDMSAHYHFILIIDTTLTTAEDRFQIWVNGVRITSWTTNTNTHAQNAGQMLGYAAGGVTQRIGANPDGTTFNDAYFSDIHYLWGNKAAASDFGQLDENGVWVPKKPTGITYGAYGAHLDFSNGSSTTTLGYDKNGVNNWTCNNVSLTAGVTYDWMTDTPTNNFCTLNPLDRTYGNPSMSDGNLKGTSSSGDAYLESSIAIPTTGKWYAEVIVVTKIGAITVDIRNLSIGSLFSYNSDTGAITGVAAGATYTVNDVIGIAYDVAAQTIQFYKNNVLQGTCSGVSQVERAFGAYIPNTSTSVAWNFGQRPFAYTPPTGFKALCTANLPAVSVAKPSLHFDTKLDTGANIKTSTEAVFTSFMEWIKDRANVNNHQLIDSVRGTSAVLQSNTTAAETTYSSPSGNSVGWVWKANGAGVSNTDGSITSTVSANQQAGFSIVTYTGTGANATVGHGLGVAPKLVIVKRRNAISDWCVYSEAIGAGNRLLLSQTNASAADATMWNSTSPTSSVFSIGTNVGINSANTFVAYCFAEIPGYSKIGSYTGNGSADGPFVWCGFRPKFILLKDVTTGGTNWITLDAVRDSFNVAQNYLCPNVSNAEGASSALDITASGFKLRASSTPWNANNATHVFIAFAEHPFGGSNVSPAPAR